MPADEPPFIADAGPRSDVHDGHAREATEHEVPSAAGPERQAAPTEQALVQGGAPTGARPTPPVGDEPPLDSVRAVRLLRAKVNELERQVKLHADRGDDRYWMLADIALIAGLLADHIERTADYGRTGEWESDAT